jgi:hypothetical protein
MPYKRERLGGFGRHRFFKNNFALQKFDVSSVHEVIIKIFKKESVLGILDQPA